MRVTNIQRTLMTPDGKSQTVTMQRYTRKYNQSFYDYTKRQQRLNAVVNEIVKEARTIKKCDALPFAIEAIKNSHWFSLNAKSGSLIDKIYNPKTSPNSKLFSILVGEAYNTLSNCVVSLPNSKHHGAGLEGVSRKSILGIGTLVDNLRDTSEADQLKKLKWAVRFWERVAKHNVNVQKNRGDDDKTVKTLNAVLSFDTEWQAKPAKTKAGVTVRSNDDVLNISYTIWLPEYPSVQISGVLFNDTGDSFNLRQLFCFFIDELQKRVVLPGKHLELERVNWLVTGYFLGVDWSTLDGWNKLNSQITTIDKQYIFTSRPFVFNTKSQQQLRAASKYKRDKKPLPDELKGVTNSVTIRDAGLLAPQGGLKALGDIVGIGKLDTEEDDIKHNHAKGYYKQHMTVYRRECPKRYFQYVLNDALIPLEYLKTVVSVYRLKWLPFSQLPMTTSNFAMRGVVDRLATSDKQQRIYRGDVSFADIKSDPRLAVRDGYADLYLLAQDGYFGGFNVAFGSFLTYGVPVDTDLSSAYNTSGNLMPYPDYSASKSQNLDDLGEKLVEVGESTPFNRLYNALKDNLDGFPFVLGVGRASVTYPDNYSGITMTPSRDGDGSPVYVRQIEHQAMPLVDMLDAYEHGATVELDSLYVPAQHYDHRTAWAEEQHYFLTLRQRAKAERNKHKKGTAQWLKYNAEQLLFKLAGNTIYGKSAQSVRPKRTRDFMTNQVEDVTISKITDPLIAGTYTAFTRYLAHHLYDAVAAVYGDDELPANVTTDGYTFLLKPGLKFDFNAVKSVFDSKLPAYYHDRLDDLGYSAGFERKGNSDDFDKPSWTFNLRTRLNGTVDIDCLEALGGIRSKTYTIKDIYDALKVGKIMLPVKGQQLSNLTEMKYGALNHMQGVLYEEPKLTRIPLQYDCAYRPSEWLPDDWQGFGFLAVPFDTVESRTWWKKHSKILTDRYNITISRDRFAVYLETMNKYSFYRVSEIDKAGYQEKARQVYAKLNGEDINVDRRYKDALGRCKRNLKAGKRVGVCFMAVYDKVAL